MFELSFSSVKSEVSVPVLVSSSKRTGVIFLGVGPFCYILLKVACWGAGVGMLFNNTVILSDNLHHNFGK